ncbi:MAG: prepilin-type N-terminal cleavage/methylation domain-containing protein [Kiritimatiellae bacterium]|nr:prepilin-type N-terminal cleavage/methylation domain-containing protein [Kiritimatiellia bacterium]
MKKAFTLIELMAVVAIIAVLLGIITTAASNSIKMARSQKAKALCACVKQGIETYHAQKDEWPGSIGKRIAAGTVLSRTNQEGVNNTTNNDKYILDGTEVRDMIREVVMETIRNNNPLMDISGLFVSRDQGEPGGRGHGLDFMDAVRGTKRSKKKMQVGEMYFGYPETDHGYFRRFKIVYSVPTDSR